MRGLIFSYFSYIVVDLMNGGDLRFHISRKAFTEEAVRFWMAELACALRYIHSQGIIHRDLKPDNVLLDSEGHVHLADFVCCTTSGHLPFRSLIVLTSSRMWRQTSDRGSLSRASREHWLILHQKCMKVAVTTLKSIGGP